MLTVERKLELHHAYWNRQELKRPLVAFQIGSQLVSENYTAAQQLMSPPRQITPDDIVVESFYADYERMYEESSMVEQEAFWTAIPFPGIPWIEGMLGCPVYSAEGSFWAQTCYDAIEQIEISLDYDNPWLKKLLEFTDKLVNLSQNRYPIGQPIMRGPVDILGALLGQEKLVYAFYDNPELVKRLAREATQVFIEVVKLLRERIPPFHNGHSFGFYPVWAPGKCLSFQEDLMALGSPVIYRDFFLACDRMIAKAYPYSTIHVHPNSFYLIPDLLEIEDLSIIEMNYDRGGPAMVEMLPSILQALEKKHVLLRGIITEADLAILRDKVPVQGLFLYIVTDTLQRAQELNNYIDELYCGA
ncbi:hypothetical protein MOOR_26860 [Moorella thermoacetica]|uniref:Uroporphyrinogen decarboxylase (URO-D) domain-containing protein n=1 Tax=Neomoorella thermoacetica TaxID=1525 RepID=A0A1J5JFU8_NEOTH|nr:hypothetical protein [Moorella thermoacetica]OIQ07708.1 hypothetical protein MOOR_26860 [Moorella thermoacetica]